MSAENLRDVAEMFAVAFGVGLAAMSYVVGVERRTREGYQRQLDDAYQRIRRLEAQVEALTQLINRSGGNTGPLNLTVGGDATIGGDLTGRDRAGA